MALYNTKPVLLLLIPFLMLHKNSETSFEFSNFSGPYTNTIITFQGDAFASHGSIQLTRVQNGSIMPFSSGRAAYALPVRLWDAKTRKMASFTTTFSFVLLNAPNVGDGITFFIAPFHSHIPQNSDGGYLGLFTPNSALRKTNQNQIVAVEFDTHQNDWDPDYLHIGIDVNSIASVKTVEWQNDNLGLETVFATVSYEPLTQNLSVVIRNGPMVSLSQVIDLRTVLPEWVSVGFSGSTGLFVEVHKIQSWSFSSSFD
ncbi:mannose/glucose-specific lectin Cramoll-like [Abrus precatorius]|uniref:Mannose/glucose-specific lectin Cramoll-like n=1 Tax=Abrus precatorius TaxID=3816 RepID=A0A8B8MK43_ABRPR|nr:mannose/glucose-specific lectin Cramoll-like [Abrus precatorius]